MSRSSSSSPLPVQRQLNVDVLETEDEARAVATQDLTGRSPSTQEQLSELADIVKNLTKVVQQQATASNAPRPTQTYRDNAVSAFDPEDDQQSMDRWLKHIEELQGLYQWAEQTTIYHMVSKLTGLAKLWYDTLPSVSFTWAQWKNELLDAFPPCTDICDTLEQMLKRKKRPDEEYVRYYYEKLALINKCKVLVGKDAVACLIGGIVDQSVQAAARAADYPEPPKLLHYLKTFKARSGARITERPTNKNHFKKPSAAREIKSFGAKQRCYNCGHRGHIAKHCRKSANYRRDVQQKPTFSTTKQPTAL